MQSNSKDAQALGMKMGCLRGRGKWAAREATVKGLGEGGPGEGETLKQETRLYYRRAPVHCCVCVCMRGGWMCIVAKIASLATKTNCKAPPIPRPIPTPCPTPHPILVPKQRPFPSRFGIPSQ